MNKDYEIIKFFLIGWIKILLNEFNFVKSLFLEGLIPQWRELST